jgi:hypothetical protein
MSSWSELREPTLTDTSTLEGTGTLEAGLIQGDLTAGRGFNNMAHAYPGMALPAPSSQVSRELWEPRRLVCCSRHHYAQYGPSACYGTRDPSSPAVDPRQREVPLPSGCR